MFSIGRDQWCSSLLSFLHFLWAGDDCTCSVRGGWCFSGSEGKGKKGIWGHLKEGIYESDLTGSWVRPGFSQVESIFKKKKAIQKTYIKKIKTVFWSSVWSGQNQYYYKLIWRFLCKNVSLCISCVSSGVFIKKMCLNRFDNVSFISCGALRIFRIRLMEEKVNIVFCICS